MIQTVFRPILLLLCMSIVPSESLVCYDCKNITDTSLCRTTQTCGQDESCFMDKTMTTNGSLYTLGCISKQQCNIQAGSGTSIIGRALTVRQDQGCHECCSSDTCAVNLCTHLAPTSCIDDETLDCSRLNTLFNLCADTNHAKSVCPRFCGLCNVVDGKWSSWSSWTNCSVTCETGTQTRTRTCTNPPPAHGGEYCHGHITEIKQCVRDLCPVHGGWTEWFPWGSCSVTCDVGMQSRSRNCTNPAPNRLGDYCSGANTDARLCLPGACVDGGWSSWNDWSNCSIKYGCGGFKTRTRTCSSPFPSQYGKDCNGTSTQINSCLSSDCVSRLSDCVSIKNENPASKSGLYNISLWKTKTKVEVYCDMDTDGGGWTVFQRRFNGSVDFYRTFQEYENGFGQKDGEFWLGLKTIQEMTSNGTYELRLDLTAADGSQAYELFQNFHLSPGRNYTLHIDKGTGTAGDSQGLSYSNGQNFGTKDYVLISNGCAVRDHGGWWYLSCTHANLNGDYIVPGTTSSIHAERGVIYRDFKGTESLKSTLMMFRVIQ